jgi:hypothetical protein
MLIYISNINDIRSMRPIIARSLPAECAVIAHSTLKRPGSGQLSVLALSESIKNCITFIVYTLSNEQRGKQLLKPEKLNQG